MSKKQSQMGTSKYEFNPEQFEIDMMNNLENYRIKYELLNDTIENWFMIEPDKMKDTYGMLINVVTNIKKKYDL